MIKTALAGAFQFTLQFFLRLIFKFVPSLSLSFRFREEGRHSGRLINNSCRAFFDKSLDYDVNSASVWRQFGVSMASIHFDAVRDRLNITIILFNTDSAY